MEVDSELIRSRRMALGLSQIKLAELAGTSQANIHRMESGQVSFSRIVPRVLRALNNVNTLKSKRYAVKHRMKLVQTIEKIFEFDAPATSTGEALLMEAWHALDEHKVKFVESIKRERIEHADD